MSTAPLNPRVAPFRRQAQPAKPPATAQRLLQLANNENPLGPSPTVAAAIQAGSAELHRYPSYGDIALRRAIVRTLGRGLQPEHIFTGGSGFDVLELIARAVLQAGDEVILSSPTFAGVYRKISLPLGARVIDVPLEPGSFRYRPEAVLAAVSERCKLVMLCNPNNPTGTVIPAAAVERLMRGLPPHVLLVADEVYHHFVAAREYPDSLRYVLDGRNIVIVHSFSKAYGLAGLRLGYGIAAPEIADSIAGLRRGFHLNRLALAAGIAACADQAHVQRSVAFIREEAGWVCRQFVRMGIRHWNTETNFVLFETALPADELEQALRRRGFLLRGQSHNGLPYAMRLSLGQREDNRAFLAALQSILAEGGS